MDKQRRTNSAADAVTSLLGAINKVAKAELGEGTAEEQAEAKRIGLEAVEQATGAIGDSNAMTAMEYLDDDIDARITAEEEAEARAEAEGVEEEAEQEEIPAPPIEEEKKDEEDIPY